MNRRSYFIRFKKRIGDKDCIIAARVFTYVREDAIELVIEGDGFDGNEYVFVTPNKATISDLLFEVFHW